MFTYKTRQKGICYICLNKRTANIYIQHKSNVSKKALKNLKYVSILYRDNDKHMHITEVKSTLCYVHMGPVRSNCLHGLNFVPSRCLLNADL